MRRSVDGFMTKLWSSLFLKIMAVLLLAAVAINWINGQTVLMARLAEQRTRASYVRQLAGRMQSQMGPVPEKSIGLRLAEIGPWRIAFIPSKAGLQGWATWGDMPSLDDLTPYLITKDWGNYKNSFFFISPRPGGTLLMMTPPRDDSLGWKYLGLRIGGLAFVMLAVWLAVGWLLKPVRWLDLGVALVGAGELGHRIPTRENDELGRLATQFNAMTGQVSSMFEQRNQMLLDVSHELRTPLTRLKLGLEALPEGEDKAGLSEDVQELEALIQELLEGARLTHGRSQLHVESVDLAALARETAAPFEDKEPGLTVEAAEHLVLQGDKMRLQRLLHNLLSNAFSHGQPARGPVLMRLFMSGNGACLTVTDQGPGLPSEHLSRLFTPFFRSDRSRARVTGGLGLGLSLCLGVARAHGGDLTAALNPGGGLVFTLTLPLA
ncbi:MAG TPA: HAMP domain-containing sensor histidine kinase [bacterium]|jgi:signal transduction histidine kinase|nr:HAMP domain-containing sensor histidine kinase [bacterium]